MGTQDAEVPRRGGITPDGGAHSVIPVPGQPGHPRIDQDSASGDTAIWRFGVAEFDERALELTVGGEPVELERKPLEVLRHLLWHAGEVVTREELLDAVWPGRILSESVINKCISRIRDVLGDADQQVIKTAHGYGYRLVADVKVEHPKSAPLPAPRFGFKEGDSAPLRPSWKLRERLGAGGHGEAWLAEHEKTREKRVYKFAFDGGALLALKREITIYRLLHDTLGERPDFVRLLDWNLVEAPCFTEAEHVEGGNLLGWSERHGGIANVPLATRIELAAQIADTLAAAHSVGVLHKDLKPSNVVVDERAGGLPRIKLMDFGSGGVINPQRLDQLGITRLGFTQVAAEGHAPTSGTPLYLAPEVVAGHPVTTQGDIYSLGVVLYQLVVGDVRKPLAPGWESDVADELLREDIAAAAHGDPQRRLPDAARLAKRLRSLDARRAERAREQEQRRREQDALAAAAHARHENEKLRARRTGLLAAVAVLVAGLAVSSWLYLDARAARAEAQHKQAQAEALANFLQWDLITAADPARHDVRELAGLKVLLDAAVPKIDTRLKEYPAAASRVMEALSVAYGAIGHDIEARRLDRKRLDDAKKLLEEGHPDAVDVGSSLSVVFHYEYDDDEYAHRLADAARAKWGPRDSRRLLLEANSAFFRFFSGDYARMLPVVEDILDRAKGLDPADPFYEWLQPRVSRPALASDLGHMRAAERELRAILQAPQSGREERIVRWRLAEVLLDTGRIEEGESLLVDALAEARKTRSDNHVYVRWLRSRIGKVRALQGRFAEASRITDEIVAEFGADFDHQPQIDWALWPSRQYVLEGRYDVAEAALRHRLGRMRPEVVDPGSPYVTRFRLLLIEALLKQGKLAEARAELDRIPPDGIATLQAAPVDTARLLRLQGLLAAGEGRLQEARARLLASVAAHRDVYGEAGHLTQQVSSELAALQR